MRTYAFRLALVAATVAGASSPLLAAPAAVRLVRSSSPPLPLERAGMVCDANGCRMGSADTSNRGPYYGRSYLGTDDGVKRALAERDRIRRERQQRETAEPGQGR